MNPLNWPGPQFLQFYIVLSALVVSAAVLGRRALKGSNDQCAANELNLLEMAYLSGGPERVADTVLVALLTAGVATFDAESHRLSIDAREALLSPELEPYRVTTREPVTRKEFRSLVEVQIEAVRARLARRGLSPRTVDARRLRWATVMLFAVPLVLGVAKIVVGHSRQHPVIILVFLVSAMALGAVWFLGALPLATRAGRAALHNARWHHSRAARAPREAEMALGFAISGAAVLVGTSHSAFGSSVRSGSSSECGSGGCGGGCGGCS